MNISVKNDIKLKLCCARGQASLYIDTEFLGLLGEHSRTPGTSVDLLLP